jgi:hypothetical protein
VRWVARRKLGHHGVKSRLLGATVLVPAIGCHRIGVEDDAIWHAGRWARRAATDAPHPCVAGDAGVDACCGASPTRRRGRARTRMQGVLCGSYGASWGAVSGHGTTRCPGTSSRTVVRPGAPPDRGCPRAGKCRRSRPTACSGAGCRATLNDRPHVQQVSIQRRPSAPSRLA